MRLRNLLIKALLISCLGIGVLAHASTVQVGTPQSVPGAVTFGWGSNGDVAPFASGTVLSQGALNVTVTDGSGTDMSTWIQSPSGNYNGGFADGSGVLVTFDVNNDLFTDTIHLAFNQGLGYLGTYIETPFYESYTAHMVLFAGATNLGTFDVTGIDSGTPGTAPFIGFLSDNAEVTGATFYVTDANGGRTSVSLGDVTAAPGSTTPVPEPGSMILLGTGLTSRIGAIRRKRQK